MRIAGHVRRADGDAATLGFELPQRGEERQELLDRVDALLTHTHVRREARDDEAEHQRVGLRRDHSQLGGLDDNGAVGRVAAEDGRQCARAAVFLPHDTGDREAAAQAHAGVVDGLRREQRAHEAALHVDGAAAVDPAVPDGRVPGRRRPRGFIADRYHVDVAVEHEVAAGARAAGAAACGSPSGRTLCGALAHPADHAEGFVTLHFGAVVGVLRQFPEVDPPDVGREPGSLHPGADGALRGALGAVETRNRDQFTQERGERGEVERVEGALFDGAQHAAAAHSAARHTGRVRHVGPPSALKDSGSPGKVTTSQPASSRRP